MKFSNLNIFSRIKIYRTLSKEIQMQLAINPNDADKFQEIFNLTVDRIYQDIMDFEKENIEKFEGDIYRLKKIFEKRYRRAYFLYGDYIRWCAEKPFGYSGDFKIIDDIYQNKVTSIGFDGLWDHWFQQLAASKSVRERKEDFKEIILNYIKGKAEKKINIMNLASGPAREIKELLETDHDNVFSAATFHCYDFDIRAIDFAQQLLKKFENIAFYQKNAIRLALKKAIEDEIKVKYDLIYSTGLFDYLDERIATKLVANLRKIMNPGGLMVISNAKDKYSNSSSIWMEWIGEWHLIYRTEEEFKAIFINAGFSSQNLQIVPQNSNVMQYCLAKT